MSKRKYGVDNTEHTPMEQAQRHVDELFRVLIENSSDIITIIDTEGVIRYESPATEGVLGYKPAELIGVHIGELFHPDDLRKAMEEMKAAVLSRTPEIWQVHVRHKDGSWRILEGVANVLDTPSITGIVINFRDITERKRAEKVQDAIYTISQAAVSTNTLDELYRSIHGILGDLMPVENFYIALYDPTSDLLSFPYFVDQYDQPPAQRKPARGLSEYVLRSGQPLLAPPEVFDHLLQQGEVELVGTNSIDWLGVPLKVKDHVIGVMVTQSYTEGIRFGKENLELFEFVSTQAAQAIERKRAEEQIQRQFERLAVLRTIDSAITGSLDLNLTLNIALEKITAHLGVDAADVLLLNPNTQTLEYAAGHGFRTSALQHTNLRLGQGYAGIAGLERKTIHVSDLSDHKTDLLRSPYFKSEGFDIHFCVPLIAKGNIKGVLEVFHRNPLEASSEWLEFLETLAGQLAIAIDSAQLFTSLQRSNAELALAYDTTLEGWSKALDLRDKETEGHTQRVAEMTLNMARAMNTFSEAELVHIRRGALLHDIGKMGVPDSILLKPDKLTDEEWGIMRRHPVYANELLSPIAYLRPALDIPYCHHEKWDGSGYPRGLNGEQIPPAARLFAVVDMYDALTSDRPYRKAWSVKNALEYIREQSGRHFDPQVVEIFLRERTYDK